MKLPVSFDQFKKSPIAAIAFLLVIVVGYLYLDNKAVHSEQLKEHKVRIEKLEAEEQEMENKLEEINENLLECLGLNQ